MIYKIQQKKKDKNILFCDFCHIYLTYLWINWSIIFIVYQVFMISTHLLKKNHGKIYNFLIFLNNIYNWIKSTVYCVKKKYRGSKVNYNSFNNPFTDKNKNYSQLCSYLLDNPPLWLDLHQHSSTTTRWLQNESKALQWKS